MVDVQLQRIGTGVGQLSGMFGPAAWTDTVETGDYRDLQPCFHRLKPPQIMLFRGSEAVRHRQVIIRFAMPNLLLIEEMMQQFMVTIALFFEQAVHDDRPGTSLFQS